MIAFEDENIRLEEHQAGHWKYVGVHQSTLREYYQCGEIYSNGTKCDTYSTRPNMQCICRKVFMKFICEACAKGTHDTCTKSNCDCQHRTEASNV